MACCNVSFPSSKLRIVPCIGIIHDDIAFAIVLTMIVPTSVTTVAETRCFVIATPYTTKPAPHTHKVQGTYVGILAAVCVTNPQLAKAADERSAVSRAVDLLRRDTCPTA